MDQVVASLLRSDFHSFADRALFALEGKEMRSGLHVELICRKLMEVDEGKLRRLVINQPPRTLKSFLSVVAFSAWKLGRDPRFKIILACHEASLAEFLADRIRLLLRSPFYQAIFPATQLRADFAGRSHFQTTAGGQVLTTSLTAGVTGHGAHLILIDDPIDAGKASSASERQQVIDQFEQKLRSRLEDQGQSAIVIVQQRLHEGDLSGYLAAQGGFEHLVVPLIAETDLEYRVGSWLWRRPAGDVLDPGSFTAEVISDLKRNPITFAAQYQQDPRAEAAALVKSDCFGRYHQIPPRAERCVLSFDTAVKATGASYSVCLVFKTDGENHYLEHVWRERVDYGPLERQAIDLAQRYRPALVVIEDAGYGPAIHSKLEPILPGKVRLEKPSASKVDRLQAVFNILNAGQVHIPADYRTFTEAFLREVCSFPGSQCDDQVDALSQYLKVMREVGPTFFTPKIISSGRPFRPSRHPMRDPRGPPMNFVPRGPRPGGGFGGRPRR